MSASATIIWIIAVAVLLFEVLTVSLVALRPKPGATRGRWIVAAAEALVMIVAARVIVPWNAVTEWIWVVSVAAWFAGIALMATRWHVVASTSEKSRWKRWWLAGYAAAMLVLSAAITWTFV